MQKVVNVSIEEISKSDGSFQNLKCEQVYLSKRGKPIDKLVFTWKAEKASKNLENSLDVVCTNHIVKPNKKKREDNKKNR